MKTTTYICDICRQSKSEDDIIPISVTYPIKKPGSTFKHSVCKSKDICKSCLDKRGMLTEFPVENTNEIMAKKNKSFEEKFIDLLCDIGVLFEE